MDCKIRFFNNSLAKKKKKSKKSGMGIIHNKVRSSPYVFVKCLVCERNEFHLSPTTTV